MRQAAAGCVFMEWKVDALVLRTADYGDNDKMVTLFSLQKGKISAALKGVKKAGARLKFAGQPFCFAEYVLASKGGRNTVVSAALTDGFYPLREDINRFYAAACVVGICDALLYDGIVNEELFLYAVNALKDMCAKDEAEVLVSFFLKALELSGYMLSLGACAGCGAELSGKIYFDLQGGCFYCADCARGAGTSEATLALLRACAGIDRQEREFSSDTKKRALKLLRAYFNEKTDSDIRALSEYIALL